ncbi:MAG: LPS export ABC transporter permease LptG [Chromatiales bacterium]|nr:LPS export ABC transporter permease LptG [Chromatiales bacterium]
MKVIRGYLWRNILGASALVLAVLLGIAGFVEFVGQLGDLGEGRYGIPQALLYVLLKLPTFGFVMLPIAVLIGSLLGLGALAARSELIVLRAAGCSPVQLARATLAAGLALGLFTLMLGEYLGPPAERFARQYRAMAKSGDEVPRTGPSTWIRDGQVFLNVIWPDDQRPEGGVFLFRVAPGEALIAFGRADALEPDASGQWVLQNFAESRFNEDGVSVTRVPAALEASGLDPDLLGLTVLRPNTLSGMALLRYVRYLQRNDLEARPYLVELHGRIAAAVAVPLMCLLAVPFVLGPLRRAGNGGRMMIGVVIGLAWFLVSRALADGGEVWALAPALTAWMPTMLLAVAAAVALARAR